MAYTPPALPLTAPNQSNLNQLNELNVNIETLNRAVEMLVAGVPIGDIVEATKLDHNTITAAIKIALRQRTLEFETNAETVMALIMTRLEKQWTVAHMRGMGQPKDPDDPESHYIPGDVRWMAEARLTLATMVKMVTPYLHKTGENLEKAATKVLNPTIFKGSDLFLMGSKGAAASGLQGYLDLQPGDLIKDMPELDGGEIRYGRHKPDAAGTDGSSESESESDFSEE